MSERDGVERVCAALHSAGVRMTTKDGSLRGRCPLHGGQSRDSLSVQHHVPAAGGGGRARIRCWGGCEEVAILEHLGLGLADLYDDPLPARARGAVREHPYVGAGGQLLGVVQRFEPKTFRPLTRNGTGWKHASTDELAGTPYRLLGVVAAIERGEPVYVVEGERDADRLAREGVAATCNAFGAGKWSDSHANWLRGADVIVCRDRDQAGETHAAMVVASLVGVAKSVRLVEPAEGKDVTEHLNAGNSLAALIPVELPERGVQASRRLKPILASAVRTRRLRWLWDGRIVLGGLTLLAGREGLGKSTIAIDVTASVTLGVLEGEFTGRPRSVVYVNSEDARDYTIVPRLIAAGADLTRVVFVDAVTPDDTGGELTSPIVLPLDVDRLADVVRHYSAAMVVLDAATSTIDSRLDGDRDRQMRQGLEGIAKGVGEATGAGVLGIVHFGKRESADTGKLILGSIAWSQVARSVIAVARDADTGELVVSTTKTNLGPGAPSLTASIIPATVATTDGDTSVGRVRWTGETTRDARELLGPGEADERSELGEAREWLLAYLEAHEHAGTGVAGAIIKAAKRDGISERTLQRARKKMGVSTYKGRDGWVWSLPDTPPATHKAPVRDTATSEDAKTPEHVHVRESRRLGTLAPCCLGCGKPLAPGADGCADCYVNGRIDDHGRSTA